MTILIIIAIIFLLAPLAKAAARRINPPTVSGVLPGEVAKLREELDQLSAQVGRLQEEQGFMLHLLSEGEKEGGALRLGRAAAEGQRSEEADPLPSLRKAKGRTDPDTPDGGM